MVQETRLFVYGLTQEMEPGRKGATTLRREQPTTHDWSPIEVTPKILGFQLANTWPKITAHDVYAMVRHGKECKNP